MKVKDLKPADYNPRTISDARLKMLKKAMDEFGDLSGVVRNIRTGNQVTAHQRLKNLSSDCPITKEPSTDKTGTVALGYIETPLGRFSYREVDWPLEKEIQANVAANNQGGENDKKALAGLFKRMGQVADPELFGFGRKAFEETQTGPEIPDNFFSAGGAVNSTNGQLTTCPKCNFKWSAS